jgi:RNA polymerase sigma-70 factor (ECF subfamily)
MAPDDPGWQAAFAQARAELPGVVLPWGRFADHVTAIAGSEALPTTHATDIYLACACAGGDAAAIGVLEQRYLLPVRGSIARYHTSGDFVDEVLQELRGKLLLPPSPRIARYGGRGPLGAWVRVAASRVAIDLLRTHEPAASVDRQPEALADADLGPEVQILREVYREAFQESLKAALAALSAKDRNLLRRHLVEHMTLEEIAGPYGVHPATIARRLQAIRDEIADSVRSALAAQHLEQGGRSTLDSLARAIRSEVYVSLSPLLASTIADKGESGGGK